MDENPKIETGFSSDAVRDPRRIVFLTRKTSAQVRGAAGRQRMAYPHLLLREAIVFELLTVALVLVALFWDAPLEQLANPILTPNPAKAPWYFVGLQELLHYLPPVVAGVLIPTLIVIALVVIPYFNVNIHGKPLWAGRRRRRLQVFLAVVAALAVVFGIYQAWVVVVPTLALAAAAVLAYLAPLGGGRIARSLATRSLPWWIMTWFITVSLALTVVGQFFRGPGWSLVWPWR